MIDRRERVVVAACFLASGAAALAFEVAALRLVGLVVGQSSRAATIVLASWMAGMAAGAALAARRAGQLDRPLRAYGLVELAISAFALATPALIRAADAASSAAAGALDPAGWPFLAVQAAAAALVLLPPTVLMGATLPILSLRAARWAPGRAAVADLYALNVAGAVAGTICAGFGAIPWLGVRGTLALSAALSAAAGAAALFVARSSPAPAPSPAEAAPRDVSGGAEGPGATRPAAALIAVGVGGAAAMAGEIAWTRALALVLGSSTYAFSAMLATHLAGVAAGAALAGRLARRGRGDLWSFGGALVLAGVAVLAVTPMVAELPALALSAHAALGLSHGSVVAIQFAVSAAVMIVPAALSGAAFPLLVHALGRGDRRVAADVGLTLAANTVGGVAGTVAAGFAAIPALGIQGTLRAVGAAYVVGGAAAWAAPGPQRRRLPLGLGVAVPLAAALLLTPRWDPRVMTAGAAVRASSLLRGGEPRTAFARSVSERHVLFYEDGPSSTVAVTRVGGVTTLSVNGKADAGDGDDLATQLLSGHLPALIHPAPRRAFVVGLGSSVTVGALAAHPLEAIDVAEIEPAVVRASRFFDHVSRRPLEDPRVRVLVDDARHVLVRGGPDYDLITSEPSNPWIAGVGNLFTVEFFEAARARLAPGGVMTQWVHVYSLSLDDIRMVIRSFQAVFPHTSFWRGSRGDLLLVGTQRPVALDLVAIARRIGQAPAVARDLAACLGDIELLPWSFVLGADEARELAGEGVRNTDDHPRLEFSAPRSLHVVDVDGHLSAIRAHRRTELPALTGLDPASAFAPASRLQMARDLLEAQNAKEAALEQVARIGDPAALPLPLRIERATLLVEAGRLDLALPELAALEALAPGDPRVTRYLDVARALPPGSAPPAARLERR